MPEVLPCKADPALQPSFSEIPEKKELYKIILITIFERMVHETTEFTEFKVFRWIGTMSQVNKVWEGIVKDNIIARVINTHPSKDAKMLNLQGLALLHGKFVEKSPDKAFNMFARAYNLDDPDLTVMATVPTE